MREFKIVIFELFLWHRPELLSVDCPTRVNSGPQVSSTLPTICRKCLDMLPVIFSASSFFLVCWLDAEILGDARATKYFSSILHPYLPNCITPVPEPFRL